MSYDNFLVLNSCGRVCGYQNVETYTRYNRLTSYAVVPTNPKTWQEVEIKRVGDFWKSFFNPFVEQFKIFLFLFCVAKNLCFEDVLWVPFSDSFILSGFFKEKRKSELF